MLLLLMRHGIAEDHADGSELDDAMRRLTPKGRRKVREMARFLLLRGLRPTHYVSSSRLRALETAQEVMEVFSQEGTPTEVDSMDMGGNWKSLVADLQALTELKDDAVVLAAGHMPSIGMYLTEATLSTGIGIEFKRAAVAALEWDGHMSLNPAQLLFYMTPKFALGEEEA